MSRGSQLAIGVASLITAVVLAVCGILLGPTLPDGATPLYCGAGFCALIAFACFFNTGRAVTLRLIALGVFGACAAYLAEERSLRAVGAFVMFGLPAAYVMIRGDYPSWGIAAEAIDAPGDDWDEADDAPTSTS